MNDHPLCMLLVVDTPTEHEQVLLHLHRAFADLRARHITGATALAHALEQPDFCLVIIKQQLSWEDSNTVLQMVKTRRRDCPVVLLTSGQNDPAGARAGGWDAILSASPADLARLPEIVTGLVDESVSCANSLSLQETQRLFQAEQEKREFAEALQAAAAAVSSNLDPNEVLSRILEQVERVITGDAFNIMLIKDNAVTITRWRGYKRPGTSKHPPRREIPLTRYPNLLKMMREGQPIVIPDTLMDANWVPSINQEWWRSYVGAPLQIGKRTLGFLNVNSVQPGKFGPQTARRLKAFADHAAAAIENARLYQALHEHAAQLEARVRERTAELEAQYARLAQVLSSTSDGIIVTDAKGQIIRTNPVAETWLTQTLRPEDTARLQETVHDLAEKAAEQPETVLELRGVDLQLRATAIPESGGAVVAVHDVSHLKALDRMKSRFISDISHEIRTPLTTIKLHAQLLRNQLPEKQNRHLDIMEMEVDRQAELIKEILEFAKIDAGHLELHRRPIDLNSWGEIILTSYHSRAEEKGLKLTFTPAPAAIYVLADPNKIQRVLTNLLTNAIHHTPEGGDITVSIAESQAQERAWVTIQIADTGVGIPAEELPHIFERFFRGAESRENQTPGAGLELAIVKELVELHGGWVTVKSQMGAGTTFTVALPRVGNPKELQVTS
ncbi:MAG: ATP-binding protein [Chloroflexota bacterium]|nr:ATP-binding protein [Chloroflexota bacterium]